jgi:hypothetical protein
LKFIGRFTRQAIAAETMRVPCRPACPLLLTRRGSQRSAAGVERSPPPGDDPHGFRSVIAQGGARKQTLHLLPRVNAPFFAKCTFAVQFVATAR